MPNPAEVVGRGTVLVDGTVCPTWDWRHVPDLFSAKAGYAGMNLQIAATIDGELAAVGPVPVHGARHDVYAFAASGLAEVLIDCPTVTELRWRSTPACSKQSSGCSSLRPMNKPPGTRCTGTPPRT